MKKLSIFFNAVVGVIVLSFVMAVVTAVRDSRKAAEPAPRSIPTPAM